jgi:hypothetical protein
MFKHYTIQKFLKFLVGKPPKLSVFGSMCLCVSAEESWSFRRGLDTWEVWSYLGGVVVCVRVELVFSVYSTL